LLIRFDFGRLDYPVCDVCGARSPFVRSVRKHLLSHHHRRFDVRTGLSRPWTPDSLETALASLSRDRANPQQRRRRRTAAFGGCNSPGEPTARVRQVSRGAAPSRGALPAGMESSSEEDFSVRGPSDDGPDLSDGAIIDDFFDVVDGGALLADLRPSKEEGATVAMSGLVSAPPSVSSGPDGVAAGNVSLEIRRPIRPRRRRRPESPLRSPRLPPSRPLSRLRRPQSRSPSFRTGTPSPPLWTSARCPTLRWRPWWTPAHGCRRRTSLL
jgi:hypothetical protein